MKLVLITSGVYSIPAMHHLASQGQLQSVVSIGQANKNSIPIELNAKHLNIPFKRFLKDELLTGLKNWLEEAKPDLVLVFGCAYKIPSALFSIPKSGFFNLHFSMLPAYRGNTPVFWQIRNGEIKGGITIHQMTEDFDSGPVLAQREMAIHPMETTGLYTSRLSAESIPLITLALNKLNDVGTDALTPQDDSKASHISSPTVNDLMIDWQTQSAEQIGNLVNAANPDCHGAITQFRGQPFKILETAAINISNPAAVDPGTIVHSDVNFGIIVACKDMQYLRITVVQLNEGIFSGFKLAGMGIAMGERFEDTQNLQGVVIK